MNAVSSVWAQGVPEVITYQGSLADSAGVPVDAPVDLVFRFYDGNGDGAVPLPADNAWSERYEGVEVTNGRFSVQLGSQTPLPSALFDNRSQLWLQVTVGEEALPRVRMTSTAFAFEAQSVVDGAAVRSLNGATDEVVLSEGDNVTITREGSELTISAAGPDGGLSSVVVEAPLTGDGTDDAPISVSEGGISTTELADNAVTTDKILNETITNAKLVDNAAVLRLNGLASGVSLVEGNNVTINTNSDNNQITISATAPDGGLTSVTTNNTLTGEGTSDNPLGIDDGGVGTQQLANDAVNSAIVADNSLTADDLAANAVEADELDNGAVTVPKINATNSPTSGDFLKFIDGELTWDSSLFSDAEEQPSSIRWKENVRTLSDPVALVERLRGVRYDWKEDGTADVGVIAEEVAEVLPEVVAFEEDGQARGVNYGKLVSVLIEATKEQQQTIEQQQQQIEALEDRMTRLEQLIQQQTTTRAPRTSSGASDGATSLNDSR